MEIIKKAERVHVTEYYHDYRWNHDENSGFSFECDKDGNIDEASKNEGAMYNLERCRNGEYNVKYNGIKTREHSYMEPAVGICRCGEKVSLHYDDIACGKCGQRFNLFGQELRNLSREEQAEEDYNDWSYSSEDLG